jgi:hypothetical protein
MKRNFLMKAFVCLFTVVALCSCNKDDDGKGACDILSFVVDNVSWDITDNSIGYYPYITHAYPLEMVNPRLTPVITLSPGATISPTSGTEQNFFADENHSIGADYNGVSYTVTAEDGVTQKTYLVKAVGEAEAIVSAGTTGECIWVLTGTVENYTLTISGNGAMKNYNYNYHTPWYYDPVVRTVVIRDGVTNIGDQAFFYCPYLTSITIPNSVTSIGDEAFSGCYGLTSITIPNSVTSIGAEAFSGCNGLISITIPNSVTSIGEKTFYKCDNLTDITIPNSVEYIGNEAFHYCSNLTDITIPNSVTSIGAEAFSGCNGLTSITIPNSVTSIGKLAFYNCYGLTTVTNLNPVPQNIYYVEYVPGPQLSKIEVRYDAFTNVSLCTLMVPASAVDAYKRSWNTFGNIIAIP